MSTGTLMAILLLLASCGPAGARCSCGSSGGGASYDFLGDPAVDIEMDSLDEFMREAEGRLVSAAEDALSLDLGDEERINLALLVDRGKISGAGNRTASGIIEPVKASGSLRGSLLSLEVTAPSGAAYSLSLAWEGSAVLGEYSRIGPGNSSARGRADGILIMSSSQGQTSS